MMAFEQLAPPQQELFLQLHGYACNKFKRAAEREMEQAWQDISELHRTVLSIYAANALWQGFLAWLPHQPLMPSKCQLFI